MHPYLYLFENNGKVEIVNERTAHTYLRNPSGSQRANLKYVGAILEAERTNLVKEVSKAKREKFGSIGMGEENDEMIIESRAFADEMMEAKMQEIISRADKAIMPGNWDYMYGNINSPDSFKNANGGLKEAMKKLH